VNVSAALVVRNLLCAGLALLALVPGAEVAAGIPGTLVGVLAAVFAVLFYLACDQLIANAQRMTGER
jgi:hypothetical protein